MTFTLHGGKVIQHVKLNRTGRRLLKQLLTADKAWNVASKHRAGVEAFAETPPRWQGS